LNSKHFFVSKFDNFDLRVPALKLGRRSADVVAREVISGTPEVVVVKLGTVENA
jgi:hypothetical protein